MNECLVVVRTVFLAAVSVSLTVPPALAQAQAAEWPVGGTTQSFEAGSWAGAEVAAELEGVGDTDQSEALADQDENSWRWAIGAYLHAVDISATTTVGEIEMPLDVTFGDLFGALKVPFSMHVEGRRDRWGFGVDFLYILVGEEGIEPVPGLGLSVGGDFTISNVELFGTYRLGDIDDPGGAFDLMAGARYRSLSLDVSISGLPMELSGGFDEGWWDVLLGGRYIVRVHPRVGLVARADIGADIFAASGGVGINIWRGLDLLIQYKIISIDHDHGSGATYFRYDATEQGPLFGIGVHF